MDSYLAAIVIKKRLLLFQCLNVAIKQMVNAIACTIELLMHLGGLLSTQEARVALGYRLVRLLNASVSCLTTSRVHLYNMMTQISIY